MKNLIFALIGTASLVLFGFTTRENVERVEPDLSVMELLIELGQNPPEHYIASPDSSKVRMGYELVHEGRTTGPDGKKSTYISKFYVCTDCHNQVREDFDLVNPTPEGRLKYAMTNDLKFLQATTFWGMINRETFYNDDYEKKYGDLVKAARYSLAESTQLCAKECSSGRYLEAWEVDALLHYYNTLGVKMSDLDLTEKEIGIMASANGLKEKQQIKDKLKVSYMTRSRAHFGDLPEDSSQGYSKVRPGDVAKGEEIYKRSCMTCHHEYGPSQLVLEAERLTFARFMRNIDKNTKFNLYEITRKGTYAEPGHRQYMPMYPLERMSNQQVEDLRAYIEEGCS